MLPTPTGSYPVGRSFLDVVDATREDPYSRRRHVPRVLPVTLWYPAEKAAASRQPGAYLPGAWRCVSWLWGLGARRTGTHAVDGAVPVDGLLPLVVLSPAANPALCHTAIAEELASHGYVVAGISHPYESMPVTAYADRWPRLTRLKSLGGALSAPGSRPYAVDLAERAAVVAVKADDIAAVALHLMGAEPRGGRAMPLVDRWGAIGHSFGGGAVAEVCRRPATTCCAGVNLDGGLWTTPEHAGVAVPFLQLFAEHPEYVTTAADDQATPPDPTDYAVVDRATTVGAWQSLHESATPGYAAIVTGATHTSFSDWPLLPLRRWSPARRAVAGVDGPAVWSATTTALRAFLDRHVGGGPTDVGAALVDDSRLRTGAPVSLFSTQPAAVA